MLCYYAILCGLCFSRCDEKKFLHIVLYNAQVIHNIMEYWTEDKLRQKISFDKARQNRWKDKMLGKVAEDFFKRKVKKKYNRLNKVCYAWQELLPVSLQDHSCIESLNKGVLKVLVDNQAYYAELDMLVRSGLADQILELEPSLPAFKIKIVRGSWYKTDDEGNKIAIF